MEAIGRLAGGIAHDFNNLLTVITGYSDLMLQQPAAATHPAPRERRGDPEGRRAARPTSRASSWPSAASRCSQPKVLDLNRVVGGLRHDARSRSSARTSSSSPSTAPDLGRVTADPGQIEQVILNLVVNARDAMPDGGRLTDRDGQSHGSARTRRRGTAASGRART